MVRRGSTDTWLRTLWSSALPTITKTKEMCIDFRRSRPSQQPISIKGVDVEVVRSYRYLGVHLDERLDWSVNTDTVYKKAQSRLYFLRRLGSFRICQKLLLMFYKSVVESVLFYAVVCWGDSISRRNAGRLDRLDLIQVHKVREQCNGPHSSPYAQRLDLGWVIIGDVCLERTRRTTSVSVFRPSVLASGRHSILSPCTSGLVVKEKIDSPEPPHSFPSVSALSHSNSVDRLSRNVFQRTQHDDKLGMSIEDELFLDLMDGEVNMDEANCWVAPLPFRPNRPHLPNNI
ncbi:hypothetical protein NFI96_032847 [Prochilodus magdalenae]|nr:hypothetical protein NFI96_032847 [Prochilodus magdalenae]